MLRRIFSPRDLRERATGLLGGLEHERFSSAAYCLTLSDAVEDRELRAALAPKGRRHSAGLQAATAFSLDLVARGEA
jgi:hypothetical protein